MLSTASADFSQLVPGVTIECRDERWLVTNVSRAKDGWRVRARGLSDFVRDTTATFFTALDQDITVFDPAKVEPRADNSSYHKDSKLWLEATLRSTPVPLYHPKLSVTQEMLADPLQYQLAAVQKALSEEHIRPRILLADAVGLGKTLEIGMILAELIRRGRGERILVVTPKHVLEQFQQEMWTRFAIPLVRLDSQGIQKVRQKLPASKNPFTYFPRVIVSMDTIKSPKYRAKLEKVRWDAVVIDEIHNATNKGSQNNELARTLAPTTESLILASATPHNGNPESFKEILRLLDPLSVFPNGEIDMEAAKKLIIRRHRNSPEVSSVVGNQWAERKEPLNIPVEATPEENAVAREISQSWVHGSTAKDKLFAWTLVKAFLSSPAALEESIKNRMKLGHKEEQAALKKLLDFNAQVTPETCAKYLELAAYLKENLGIGPKSKRRVVVFSERVPTLSWLTENLPKHLGLKKDQVKMMHGQLSDTEQMELIDEFKREASDIRVLVTGDVASEGVNLHSQCHDLVHFDIPWSLIRIQQRNGRVDRYGQKHNPQITTLLLDTQDVDSIGELRVLTKLIEREHEAHKILGDASSLMGMHSTKAEEDAIREVLAGQRLFDDTVLAPADIASGAHAVLPKSQPEQAKQNMDIEALLAGFLEQAAELKKTETVAPAAPTRKSLFNTELEYFEVALEKAFIGQETATHAGGGVGYQRLEDSAIVEFQPTPDLQRRLDFLPQDYVDYRKVKERLLLATTHDRANLSLKKAREGDSQKSWPAAHFLGPLHPVTEWAVDRALARMSNNQIFTVPGDVPDTTILLLGTLTNERGQVVTSTFLVASPGPLSALGPLSVEAIQDPYAWLKERGLNSTTPSRGDAQVPDELNDLIAKSVAEASHLLATIQDAATEHSNARVARWEERAERWISGATGQLTIEKSKKQKNQERKLLLSTTPSRSLIRPLVILVPKS